MHFCIQQGRIRDPKIDVLIFNGNELVAKSCRACIEGEIEEGKGIGAARLSSCIQSTYDEKGQEDYTAIDKGLKHATSIYGVVDPQKSEGGNTYNFLFSPETQADIKALEDKIKARLLNKHD